ncbi:MAG: redox-regulated ATPase YchF [Candidatus Levybacteria bacterium]|nr:redox-regulated ATPase YchF [Candidatus Levybacteria bacterium]
MNLSVGIVGLPNVGKSTLFNALLKKQAALAANYPFATIEPNVGVVAVPDARLNILADITKLEEGMGELPPLKPAMIEFVDIAGLVKGAHEGEGLGNKFLSHIREVKVIAHVVRAFEDKDVIREGSIGVREDYETITTELILADLDTLEKVNDKTLRTDNVLNSAVTKLKNHMNTGLPARSALLTEGEEAAAKQLSLLTSKPELIVLNVTEGDYQEAKFDEIISEYALTMGMEKANFVVISAKIESELAELGEADAKEYLKELGVEKSGLERLIQKAYEKLGLMSFLTCGEKEVRAWTVKIGASAVEAAGEIHTDFMDKFIKAEIVGFSDFVQCHGWKGAREKGKAGLQGKDHVMQDGDVVEFKIGR